MSNKLLIITPHLSTGGSPQYVLEYILHNKSKYSEIKLIEFSIFSDVYDIQKNKIKNIIGEHNMYSCGYYLSDTFDDDKKKALDIIDEYAPDIIWMNEFPEAYEYRYPPDNVIEKIYRPDRKYHIFETTHYNAFDFGNKRFIPDSFMFCMDSHITKSEHIDIPKCIWKTPMVSKKRPNRETQLNELGIDPTKLHVLNVGLFNANKNQKYIYELASKFGDEVQFHFIGNDCFLDQCDIPENLLENNNCVIWGERGDVESFMSCMDIYLFPSKKELNPITVREALSNNMEVIVNRDEYVDQYTHLPNFHIMDEINTQNFIKSRIKKDTKFLIVTSFYNNTNEQIDRTFECVINQTHNNWIYIVGDDGSTNGCDKYLQYKVNTLADDRIVYYQTKFKRELYLYQNLFTNIQYDYYLDLDSDDYFRHDALEIYDKHYRKFPDVYSIFCDSKVIDGEDGDTKRYALVKPTKNILESFNDRTYEDYYEIWDKYASWSMFGMLRSFRKPKTNSLDIIHNGKTATDSMVLMNSLIYGEHLHLPISLYTYVNRDGSDSSTMSDEEYDHFNDNTKLAFNKIKYAYNEVYDSIYEETSAIIMSGLYTDVSLITEILSEDVDKIKFLYSGDVKVNDYSCTNLIYIENKIKPKVHEDKNVFIYKHLNNYKTGDAEKYLSSSTEAFMNLYQYDRFYSYFRHIILSKSKNTSNKLIVDDFYGIQIDILGDDSKSYNVEFLNGDKPVYSDTITNNMYCSPSVKYFMDWVIKVNGEIVYKQNLENKNVLIEFDSSSLGDTISWFPAVEDFRKKHNCNVTVLTYKNFLIDKSKYPNIDFIEPGDTYHNIHKIYKIGWFYKNDDVDFDLNRNDFKKMPLTSTIYDILGLEDKQGKPHLNFNKIDRIVKEKYITFSPHSTALAKYWNKPKGWQNLINILALKGYKLVMISNEPLNKFHNNKIGGALTNIIDKTGSDLNVVMNLLHYSEFHIGVSSGLSWLSWAMNVKTVIISGFSEPYTEMEDCIRIYPTDDNLCKGCFNTHKLDPSDWDWCPLHKGTSRQFECSKSIKVGDILKELQLNKLIE